MAKNSPNKYRYIFVGALTLIIGLAVGFGVGRASEGGANAQLTSTNRPSSATKAADLRASLVALGVQRVQLSASALDATFDGSKDAGTFQAALHQNGQDLGKAIGQVYGDDTQSKLQSLLNRTSDDLLSYASAVKQNDSAAKTIAQNNLGADSDELSTLLSVVNPNLPKATLQQAFSGQISSLTTLVDDRAGGNVQQELSDENSAVQQIETFMSTIASSIVTQYPDKF